MKTKKLNKNGQLFNGHFHAIPISLHSAKLTDGCKLFLSYLMNHDKMLKARLPSNVAIKNVIHKPERSIQRYKKELEKAGIVSFEENTFKINYNHRFLHPDMDSEKIEEIKEDIKKEEKEEPNPVTKTESKPVTIFRDIKEMSKCPELDELEKKLKNLGFKLPETNPKYEEIDGFEIVTDPKEQKIASTKPDKVS